MPTPIWDLLLGADPVGRVDLAGDLVDPVGADLARRGDLPDSRIPNKLI